MIERATKGAHSDVTCQYKYQCIELVEKWWQSVNQLSKFTILIQDLLKCKTLTSSNPTPTPTPTLAEIPVEYHCWSME